MMATTHMLVGLAIACGVYGATGDYAIPAAIGGILGGLFPDFDVAWAHRKTLHFPAYYSLLSVPAVLVAIVAPAPVTVGAALFVVAAALHSVSDVIGSGPKPRPWAQETSRAVYVHPLGRWARPREWVRYDGAPEDLLLALVLAVPALWFYDGFVQALVLLGLVVSLLYTVFRKPIGRRIEDSTGDTVHSGSGSD